MKNITYAEKIAQQCDGSRNADVIKTIRDRFPSVAVVHVGSISRYILPDKSVIVLYPSGWDIGYVDCSCMRGAGHHPDCESKED